MIEVVKDELKAMKKEGRSVLLVEQNIDIATEICDRIYILENGMIKYEGSPKETTKEIFLRYIGVKV